MYKFFYVLLNIKFFTFVHTVVRVVTLFDNFQSRIPLDLRAINLLLMLSPVLFVKGIVDNPGGEAALGTTTINKLFRHSSNVCVCGGL